MLEPYLTLLNEGYREAQIAFESLADHHVWQRPAPGLLSIGEIAGHVAYWQAVKFAGQGGPDSDLSKCLVSSPLIDRDFRYYSTNIAAPPPPTHIAMSAHDVCSELLRVHNESVVHLRAINPNLESHPPGWPANYTYAFFLSYAVFHIAYHTGQIYSARHLLRDNPPDN